MKVETTRFGSLVVEEGEMIRMVGPIFGFDPLTRFVLLIDDEGTPLWWLQSLEDPGVAFVVVNPCLVRGDYDPEVPAKEMEALGIGTPEAAALMAIVTVRLSPFRVTANLKAPILVNTARRTAKQIVLEDPDSPIQYDLFDPRNGLAPLEGRADRGGAGRLGKCVAAAAP